MKAVLAALLLTCVLSGCGSDGVFIISFTSGIIEGDPRCRNNTGQFDLREQGGLVVFVAISSSTVIFLGNGQRGTCSDLAANSAVQVRGPQKGDTITAQSVTVQ